MRICFFGGYDQHYPRNSVIKRGLRLNGVQVRECGLGSRYKFWQRYPLLFLRFIRSCSEHSFFFIPEFCQKDVPMARFLSLLTSRKIIFDPLASRYETKISDWKTKPADSLHAWWNFKIDDWAFILSDIVLADTQAHKDYYCQTHGIHPSKIEVLPVGYDDELYKPLASKEEEGKFRVLFFGSFLPLHGVEVVVETARIISGEDPEVRFELVGSGQTLSAVKSLACELGLENVRFEGWLPQRRLPRRIASADICLGIFGKTEKARRVIPHKVYQAMGMRKPVVTARTPAVVEFFSHKENIFLVREPQAESLAEAVLELKRDRDLRERIAAAGYRLAREEFSSPVIGRKLIRIIKSQFNLF